MHEAGVLILFKLITSISLARGHNSSKTLIRPRLRSGHLLPSAGWRTGEGDKEGSFRPSYLKRGTTSSPQNKHK